MVRVSRVAIAGLVTACAACTLAVDLSGLTGGESGDGGSADAMSDGGTHGDGSPNDANTDGGTFSCAQVDATYCDDFNRDAALASGTPWQEIDCASGGRLSVNNSLVTSFGAVTSYEQCFMESNPTGGGGHFSLEFDMSLTTDPTSGDVVVASVTNQLAQTANSGVSYVALQLLVNGSGLGTVGSSFYYPDASASVKPGNSYPFYVLATAASFVKPSTVCHITLILDAITPAAQGSATCDGTTVSLKAQSPSPPSGFAAPTQIKLGYTNSSGNDNLAWSLTYDNMVFKSAP